MSIFRFFASLKLALILLAVLIVGLAGGTIVESQHSAAFAKAHVYDAPWFSLWLAFLIINLTCAALIRYPWKPHLTGFVITHAGIIVMLVGAKVGQVTGVEGGMDLHVGAPPNHVLEKFDDQWIEVGLPESGRIHKIPFALAVDRPTPNRPMVFEIPEDHLTVRVLDLQPVDTTVVAVPIAGAGAGPEDLPALRFRFESARMGQEVDEWLTLGQRLTPGPIEFRFVRGTPPKPAATDSGTGEGAAAGKVRSVERFFFFQTAGMTMMKSGQQIGPDSGLEGQLTYTDGGTAATSKATLSLTLQGKAFTLELMGQEGKELPLKDTPYAVLVEKVFRNLHVGGAGAEDAPDGPAKMPAALVKLFGPLVDPAAAPAAGGGDSPHGGGGMMGGGKGPGNQLFFYLAPDGQIQYWGHSPTRGDQAGPLLLNTPLKLGWADMQVELKAFYPRARQLLYFRPLGLAQYDPEKSEGLRAGLLCEVDYNGARQQVWIGRQRRDGMAPQAVLCNGKTVNLQFGAQTVNLDFDVGLRRFEVPKFEGTMNPMDYKATLEIGPPSEAGGAKEVSQIFMNNPTNYPNNGYGAYLGTSYKFSQANFDPRDPTYSGLQVLLDPGWSLKWFGALMISFGIFVMFYLKPYFHGRRQPGAQTPAELQQAEQAQQAAADILKRAKALKAGSTEPAQANQATAWSTPGEPPRQG